MCCFCRCSVHCPADKLLKFSAGAGLTSLYRDSSSFPIYQPALNINSVIYTITVTGGLKVPLITANKQRGKVV